MKPWGLFLILSLLLAVSCASKPTIREEPPNQEYVQPEPVQQPAAKEPIQEPAAKEPIAKEPETEPITLENPEPVPQTGNFDPLIITQEEFDTTKSDIQQLVQNLNRIIRAGNYNSWLTYLGTEYREMINSKEFLDDLVTRYPVFKGKIRNARDYFTNVVVPSRANDRVDDIEFVSKNQVTAYTLDSKGQRLILYNLENIDNSWKIVH